MSAGGRPVLLWLRATGLRRADLLSKSDPYVVVLDLETRRELGRTETVQNSHTPSFNTPVRIVYTFEISQWVRFEVRDDDGKGAFDLLGDAEAHIAKLLRLPAGQAEVPVPLSFKGKKAGALHVYPEEVKPAAAAAAPAAASAATAAPPPLEKKRSSGSFNNVWTKRESGGWGSADAAAGPRLLLAIHESANAVREEPTGWSRQPRFRSLVTPSCDPPHVLPDGRCNPEFLEPETEPAPAPAPALAPAPAPELRIVSMRLDLYGSGLAAKDRSLFGKGSSDPYAVLSRSLGNGRSVELARTNVVPKNLNPIWSPIEVPIERLAGGEPAEALGGGEITIDVTVWDKDKLSKDDLIGRAQLRLPVTGDGHVRDATLRDEKSKLEDTGSLTAHVTFIREAVKVAAAAAEPGPELEPAPASQLSAAAVERARGLGLGLGCKPGTKSAAYFLLAPSPLAQAQAQVWAKRESGGWGAGTKYPKLPRPTSFVQALHGGLEVVTLCALDYTGSNGNMHDVVAGAPNPYEECVAAVTSILLEYDADGRLPLLGYGGKTRRALGGKPDFPPYFTVRPDGAESVGVGGILADMAAYRGRITLGDMGSARGGDMEWRASRDGKYYCDDFYAVINRACDDAQRELETAGAPLSVMPRAYRVLFLVIDGDGFDQPGTRRAIVRASALPISIVLIGVGNNAFKNLSEYDADDSPLTAPEGVSAVRDAVQFVRFNDFRQHGAGGKSGVDLVRLAAEVLREVPTQVEDYCGLYGIQPPADPGRPQPPPPYAGPEGSVPVVNVD